MPLFVTVATENADSVTKTQKADFRRERVPLATFPTQTQQQALFNTSGRGRQKGRRDEEFQGSFWECHKNKM